MTADRDGAIWHHSPNFGDRRGGATPRLIVLHYTAMASAAAALDRLCDPAWEVSAHYLIGADGRLWQLVAERDRAWHAGAGGWGGIGDVNSASIGIELDNDGASPFSEPLMARLEPLLAALLADHALPSASVIGHADMAPGRKHDPGPRFDWRRLARQRLAVWPGPAADRRGPAARAGSADCPPDAAAFAAAARRFGYPDAPPDTLLAVVRDRFRPGARGPLCAADAALMADLAASHPAGH